MDRTTCKEPQSLYKGLLYLYLYPNLKLFKCIQQCRTPFLENAL